MSKVITFSRNFPAYHPKKGKPTYFVEKVLNDLTEINGVWNHSIYALVDLNKSNEKITEDFFITILFNYHTLDSKGHTIREGERWKVGDKFSPRVWSGKPYYSKQIIIAADIEIKKIWTFEVDENGVPSLNGKYIGSKLEKEIARNDGLSKEDFIDWLIMPSFKSGKPFKGQVICWDERIEY
ncbi:MAG: hypothetical protein EOO42_04300 [Flavobacteriales bacterium]|nr:MAG: hypothetical protein EOO42_04300 [Flavobacteriales bacterium]